MLSIRLKLPVCISGKFLVANGSAFSWISRKEHNPARDHRMFVNFLPEITVPFDFALRISGIFGWMVLFSEIQQFMDCLKIFVGNFCTICPRFKILGIFGWMEMALGQYSLIVHFITRHCEINQYIPIQLCHTYKKQFNYFIVLSLSHNRLSCGICHLNFPDYL